MSEPKGEKVSPKIGEGHLAAMARLGGLEVRGALYTESNVAQPAEYGIFGTATPGEVAEARRSPDMSDKGSPSILNDTMNRAADRSSDRSARDREVEMER